MNLKQVFKLTATARVGIDDYGRQAEVCMPDGGMPLVSRHCGCGLPIHVLWPLSANDMQAKSADKLGAVLAAG